MKAKAKAQPAATGSAMSSASSLCYADARAAFAGSEKEWRDSELRKQLVAAMPFAEVVRRRFQQYRPDLFGPA